MKLWQKEYQLDKEIERFTVGDDYLLDQRLIFWDCVGSISHAKMLYKINILDKKELLELEKELTALAHKGSEGQFAIKPEQEDVHTAIEEHLTSKLGDLGKKIHTARSRNDQVLVDIRLYSKQKLLEVEERILELCETLLKLADENKEIPVAGYTHMQRAMPSSMGLLFGAYLESLLDNLELFKAVYKQNNQSPLGSAAGYGVSFPINREYTAELLGFSKVQNNVMYVQNSRGKIESNIIFALNQTMQDLGKLSTDLLLFSMTELGFINLPVEFCTGSSIMPQKKNPDVLELVRGKSSVMQGNVTKALSLTAKLPSGYNRDYQLAKKILFESFDIIQDSVVIMNHLLKKITVNIENCEKSLTKEVFAADYANELVRKGMPFREAYMTTTSMISKIRIIDPKKNIMNKTHTGAPGNLRLKNSRKELDEITKIVLTEKKRFEKIIQRLV